MTVAVRLTDFLRRYRVTLAGFAVLGGVRLAWHPAGRVCMAMTTVQCVAVATAVVALATLAATAVRVAWLASSAGRAVRRLPVVDPPGVLRTAAGRAGLRAVRCHPDERASAFCTGLLAPRVHVTTGLLRVCDAQALQAVLLHEGRHARRRDPLRRAWARAASEVLFCVPVLTWWHARQAEASELAADRAALERLGAAPLARALYATVPAPTDTWIPAFDGAGEARVAQLLGDRPPVRHLPAGAVAVSLLSLGALVALAMCVGQAAWS